jgi:hypothetical protein
MGRIGPQLSKALYVLYGQTFPNPPWDCVCEFLQVTEDQTLNATSGFNIMNLINDYVSSAPPGALDLLAFYVAISPRMPLAAELGSALGPPPSTPPRGYEAMEALSLWHLGNDNPELVKIFHAHAARADRMLDIEAASRWLSGIPTVVRTLHTLVRARATSQLH